MEGDHQARPQLTKGGGTALAVGVLTGALIATMAAVTLGFGLAWIGGAIGHHEWAENYRQFLANGGWWLLALWGAAAGALLIGSRLASPIARTGALLGAAALVALPLVLKAQYPSDTMPRMPATAPAKRDAILRWSYRSLPGLEQTLELSRDPDPTVREQAVIALGRNLVVSDLEREDSEHPPRFATLPLRHELRERLFEVMRGDTLEMIRIEAANALWTAPRAFGSQPEAAETLRAVVARGDSTSLGVGLARRALAQRPDSAAAEQSPK